MNALRGLLLAVAIPVGLLLALVVGSVAFFSTGVVMGVSEWWESRRAH